MYHEINLESKAELKQTLGIRIALWWSTFLRKASEPKFSRRTQAADICLREIVLDVLHMQNHHESK